MQEMLRSSNNMNKGILAAIISSMVVFLDYLTKSIIVARVSQFESIKILPFLQIVHVENEGAAFGLFRALGNNVFIIISFIAIFVIIIYLLKLRKGLEFFSLSLILGGAAGNLIGRIKVGKVIDYIDIYAGKWHWPAFNIADSALTIGIILFLWSNLRCRKNM
ncbi:MAG TPA: signal peptidase II [Nitrospirae bacterium]|nr:signal peptidase II [Nitrospirota bacterium]